MLATNCTAFIQKDCEAVVRVYTTQEQNSDVFHGFIRVVMNLIRPVQMSLPGCDVTATSRNQDSTANVTTFHLPKDTTKVIHITRCVSDSNGNKDNHNNNVIGPQRVKSKQATKL